MTTIHLGCSRAGTLLYEPGGLLLHCCLIPVGTSHGEHLLTFQLGYLGPGEITVHITLDGEPGTHGSSKPTTVLLRGTDADDDESAYLRIPGVWLTHATVSDSQVNYRYTVSGQSGPGSNGLRGEVVTELTGALPLLTVTTREMATRKPLPESVRSQPVMDWDQTDGSGSEPCCPISRARTVPGGRHQRAFGPMRNICT